MDSLTPAPVERADDAPPAILFETPDAVRADEGVVLEERQRAVVRLLFSGKSPPAAAAAPRPSPPLAAPTPSVPSPGVPSPPCARAQDPAPATPSPPEKKKKRGEASHFWHMQWINRWVHMAVLAAVGAAAIALAPRLPARYLVALYVLFVALTFLIA